MNRKRKDKKKIISNFDAIFAVVVTLLCIAGFVNYTILRNKQVELDHKMQVAKRHIKEFQADTNSIKVEIDRQISRFAIKSELKEMGSSMRERPDFVIERIYSADRPIALGSSEFPVEVNQYTSTSR